MIKRLSQFYFSLLIFTSLTPQFNAADKMAADYLALTLVAIFGITVAIFKKGNNITVDKKITTPLILYFTFIIVSAFSIVFSINKAEGLVALLKLSIILIHLYLIYELRIYEIFKLNQILTFFTVLLTVEIFNSLFPLYYEILPVKDYEYSFSGFLVGLAGNRNVTAASIVLKIPIVLMLMYRSKKFPIKILLTAILTIAFINLFFLSSRAALLSLSFFIVFYSIHTLIYCVKEKNYRTFLSKALYIVMITVSSYTYFQSKVVDNDRAKIESRVTSISTSDQSVTERLRFYKQSFNYFLKNPFNPVGLGNWKLYSINQDKENIIAYIVPYVVHNDFLEILVETSFLGFLIYLSIFLYLIYILGEFYLKESKIESKNEIFFLFLALMIYLVDANLNFPLYRPIMQINLLVIITLILTYIYSYKISYEK